MKQNMHDDEVMSYIINNVMMPCRECHTYIIVKPPRVERPFGIPIKEKRRISSGDIIESKAIEFLPIL